MVNEKDVLRQEEIDFRSIFNRIKRGWPIILLSLGIWLIIGIIFQLTFPPRYTAKTTILIEKPKGVNDPGVMVTRISPFTKQPDDYYYSNQQVRLLSYPLVRKAIESVGTTTYVKAGLIDRELYKSSPITVEVDSTYMSFKKSETPYGTTFYVDFENFDRYHLEADGKYPVTQREFELEGEFRFGEWVTFEEMRFRILANDTIANENITLVDNIFEEKYGFRMDDPEAMILNYISSIEVEQEILETTAFMVSLAGNTPVKQIEFLNALITTLVDDHLDQKTRSIKLAISYLDEEIEKLSELLSTSGSEIESFKVENAITSLNHEGSLLLDQSVKLENERVVFVVKQRYYEYLEKYLTESDDYTSLISPQAFGVKDELIIKLTEELVRLQQDLNSLELQNAQANPAYGQIKAKIAQNREIILNSVEGFMASNKMMLENLSGRLSDIDVSMRELPGTQRQLLNMERFFRVNESLFLNFLERKAEAEISLVSTTSDFHIIEPAYLTTVDPTLPWLPITLFAAIVLGFFFAFAYLLFKWVFNNKVDDSKDLMKYTPSTYILGEIFHTNITTTSDLNTYSDSQLSNQISTIFHRMLRKKPGIKSLGISSYKSGEGKTYVASMLSTQVARLGYKTIAVDLNFRQPQLKNAFGISQGANIMDVMNGSISLREAVTPTKFPNLDIAELGIKSALTDFDLQAINGIIETLKDTYDLVILDTAPFGNVSGTLTLLNTVDFPVIVMRRKHTSFQDLEDVENILRTDSLSEANAIVLDTFHPEITFSLNRGRRKYYRNKPESVFSKIKSLFVRI